MGIRTGADYLKGLQDGREVWFRGEQVKDVTQHPGLRRGAHTLAGFLDRQHDTQYRDIVTYADADQLVAIAGHQDKASLHIYRFGRGIRQNFPEQGFLIDEIFYQDTLEAGMEIFTTHSQDSMVWPRHDRRTQIPWPQDHHRQRQTPRSDGRPT